jgi:excisionase family DNA binding protein
MTEIHVEEPCTTSTTAINENNIRFKLLYDKKDAAELLSISVRSIDYLIAEGQLRVRRVGRRVLIPYQSLQQFTRSDHSGRPATRVN